jgi:uncharacterized membrane protein
VCDTPVVGGQDLVIKRLVNIVNPRFTVPNLRRNLFALTSRNGEALLPGTRSVNLLDAWDAGLPFAAGRWEGTTMSETFWIIGEIIVGIAFLGVLSAVVTLIMTRLLSKPPGAAEILGERYARGELTREQYERMRQDTGIGPVAGEGLRAGTADGRDAGVALGSRQVK